MFLPKYSYFGDYQILLNLKSNLIYKTHMAKNEAESSEPSNIIFMCIEKQALNYLCELFPRTAENITKRSIERRKHFIAQKRTNSKSFYEKMILKGEHKRFIDNQTTSKKIDVKGDPYLHQFSDEDEFMSDEGADVNLNAQTSDMKEHLNT